MGKQKKKPKKSWLEITEFIVGNLAGLADSGFKIHQKNKG